jgi:hypothetical protein
MIAWPLQHGPRVAQDPLPGPAVLVRGFGGEGCQVPFPSRATPVLLPIVAAPVKLSAKPRSARALGRGKMVPSVTVTHSQSRRQSRARL